MAIESSAVPERQPALARAERLYQRHLPSHDPVPTRAIWAAYVANQVLKGDPVWLLIVGGSGVGKTERLMPVCGLPGVHPMSAVTGEAAFLSASPKKDHAGGATGGALRMVGSQGVLLMKDFTTILSMQRDRRAEVLAALREIYDGKWNRYYGTDGGQVVSWEGKCGLLAGCTPAIDSAHAVLAEMGPRALFVRPLEADPEDIGGYALDGNGGETAMRRELSDAVHAMLLDPQGEPHEIGDRVREALIAGASLAAQSRSPVERDYRHNVTQVSDPEAPTRVVKQLGQIWRARGLIGLDPDSSWRVVKRAAVDSIPKLRRSVVSALGKADSPMQSKELAVRVKYDIGSARTAVSYATEDLQLHGIVRAVTLRGDVSGFMLSDRARTWYDLIAKTPC